MLPIRLNDQPTRIWGRISIGRNIYSGGRGNSKAKNNTSWIALEMWKTKSAARQEACKAKHCANKDGNSISM